MSLEFDFREGKRKCLEVCPRVVIAPAPSKIISRAAAEGSGYVKCTATF
jgi:hypothetical protein